MVVTDYVLDIGKLHLCLESEAKHWLAASSCHGIASKLTQSSHVYIKIPLTGYVGVV